MLFNADIWYSSILVGSHYTGCSSESLLRITFFPLYESRGERLLWPVSKQRSSGSEALSGCYIPAIFWWQSQACLHLFSCVIFMVHVFDGFHASGVWFDVLVMKNRISWNNPSILDAQDKGVDKTLKIALLTSFKAVYRTQMDNQPNKNSTSQKFFCHYTHPCLFGFITRDRGEFL